LRFDTNNVEIAAIFAPKPLIMVAASGDWTKNTATEEYPAVKAIYELYDKAANVEMFYQDAPHNYNKAAREAVYAFFGKHVLGNSNPAQFKERGVKIEKLQDMLALSNRKLPDNALDFPGVFEQWKKMGREAAAPVTDPNQQREMLELALGAEWPAKVLSETSGDTVTLSRDGRGDRVTLHRATAGPVLINHTWSVDLFQRTGPTDTKMFLTFNRSDDANRVQDILTALAWINAPVVDLTCEKNTVHCLFAAAISHRPVKLKAPLTNFTGADQDYLDHFSVPGIQRAGGLRVATSLVQ